MRRIGGGIIIGLVASDTSIRDISIIPVMTLVAVNRGMSAGQRVIGIMNSKCGRGPSWICSVARGAISRYPKGTVWWIGSAIVISLVAPHTGIWDISIIAVMTLVAVNRRVSPG